MMPPRSPLSRPLAAAALATLAALAGPIVAQPAPAPAAASPTAAQDTALPPADGAAPAMDAPANPPTPLRVVALDEALRAALEDELRAAGYLTGAPPSPREVHVALDRDASSIRVVVLRGGSYCGETVVQSGDHGGIGSAAAISLRAAEAVRALLAGPGCLAAVEPVAAPPPPPPPAPDRTAARAAARAERRRVRRARLLQEEIESNTTEPDGPHPIGRLDLFALMDTIAGQGPLVGVGAGFSGYLSSHARLGLDARYSYALGVGDDKLHSIELVPAFDWDFIAAGAWTPTLGAGLAARFSIFVHPPFLPPLEREACCYQSADQLSLGPRLRASVLHRTTGPWRFALAANGGFDWGGWRIGGEGVFGIDTYVAPVIGADLRVGWDIGIPDAAAGEDEASLTARR